VPLTECGKGPEGEPKDPRREYHLVDERQDVYLHGDATPILEKKEHHRPNVRCGGSGRVEGKQGMNVAPTRWLGRNSDGGARSGVSCVTLKEGGATEKRKNPVLGPTTRGVSAVRL